MPAVMAFLAVATQWRTAQRQLAPGVAGTLWIGLDYTAAKVGMEAAGIAITPDLWDQVMTMEAAAVSALNEEP